MPCHGQCGCRGTVRALRRGWDRQRLGHPVAGGLPGTLDAADGACVAGLGGRTLPADPGGAGEAEASRAVMWGDHHWKR